MTWKRPAPTVLEIPKDPSNTSGRFWRPNDVFIESLTSILKGKRVLEVFAGNGLMAGILAQRGIDVLATSVLTPMDAHSKGIYHPIIELNAVEAVADYGLGRNVLLMCWPTVTKQAMKAACLWSTQAPALREIVYIGEFTDYAKDILGGCASDEFFDGFEVSTEIKGYEGNDMERAVVGVFSISKMLQAPVRPYATFEF